MNSRENMVVSIIPARGKSKGIPKKNIRPLFGRPLIAWIIEQNRQRKINKLIS